MAKLVLFWYDRSKLTRLGIVWACVLQLVRVVFWYFTQNVSLSTIQTATTVDNIYKGIGFLEALFVLLAIIGVVTETSKKRVKKDDGAVKMADGVWMIKK
jgi:hypothetical protein